MRKFLITGFLGLSLSLGFLSCGLHDLYDGLGESKMVEALQQALVLGSKTAASNLGDSSCETASGCVTGYLGNELVEILLPDTVKSVLDKINSFTDKLNALPALAQPLLQNSLGSQQYNSLFNMGKYGDSIKTALNRGAEHAAPQSISVFSDAIFGMSFVDAKELLMGDSVAATSYLHNTTYSGLKSAFGPIIKEPLDLLNPNKFWRPIVSNYNSFASSYSSLSSNLSSNFALSSALSMSNSSLPGLPYESLPEDISEYLAGYATGKALDGLFLMVGKQESQLRADPWGTVSALGEFITDSVGNLLGDIFSKAKSNEL